MNAIPSDLSVKNNTRGSLAIYVVLKIKKQPNFKWFVILSYANIVKKNLLGIVYETRFI